VTCGSPDSSTTMSARSVVGSVPTTVASKTRLSHRITWIRSGARDDVVVRQYEAVLRHQEPGPVRHVGRVWRRVSFRQPVPAIAEVAVRPAQCALRPDLHHGGRGLRRHIAANAVLKARASATVAVGSVGSLFGRELRRLRRLRLRHALPVPPIECLRSAPVDGGGHTLLRRRELVHRSGVGRPVPARERRGGPEPAQQREGAQGDDPGGDSGHGFPWRFCLNVPPARA
jgi:hypothetical protein